MSSTDEEFEQSIKDAQTLNRTYKIAIETAERLTSEENSRHEREKAKIRADYAVYPTDGGVFSAFWRKTHSEGWMKSLLAVEYAKHKARLRRIELTRLVAPAEDLRKAKRRSHNLLDRQIKSPPKGPGQ